MIITYTVRESNDVMDVSLRGFTDYALTSVVGYKPDDMTAQLIFAATFMIMKHLRDNHRFLLEWDITGQFWNSNDHFKAAIQVNVNEEREVTLCHQGHNVNEYGVITVLTHSRHLATEDVIWTRPHVDGYTPQFEATTTLYDDSDGYLDTIKSVITAPHQKSFSTRGHSITEQGANLSLITSPTLHFDENQQKWLA